MTTRPPVPPFTLESAIQKVRLAEDSWNSRDPERVSQGYAVDSRWRNRSEFVTGRQDIVAFLARKWVEGTRLPLIKELWAFTGNRIAVRFALRMARRLWELVSVVRQRELGIQRRWSDADALCLHQ